MEEKGDLILRSINGLSPEEYMRRQNAAEQRTRNKNRKEHLLYACFVGVMLLLAGTPFQYTLTAVVTVCGWIWLWLSQNKPYGPDDGVPRIRGISPILALPLLMLPVAAVIAFGMLLYSLVAGIF